MPEQIAILGRQIELVLKKDLAGLVSQLSCEDSHSVFFCNVHMIMLAQEDQALAKAMDMADWIFADGVPIAWLQRRICGKDAKVIRGYEIMLAVCEFAASKGETVGFMGSTPCVMENLVKMLSGQFTNLQVSYQYCPPFMPGELESTEAELQTLKTSGVQWLFVGLGCPKQEKWIAKHASELHCHILGVGAAFEWLSGLTRKPPDWMEQHGLGWFYRLLQNPRRMWYRYLIYNIKFMIKSATLLARNSLQ